jgi:predicted nucleic acid-binding protein
MIVVDTNIIAHTWLPSDLKEKIKALIVLDNDWIAPILWRSEFRSVLSKLIREDLLSESKAIEIADLAEGQMATRELNVPTKSVISIVKKSTLSSYDSEFVALATFQNLKFVTLDKKIAREFPQIAILLDDFI